MATKTLPMEGAGEQPVPAEPKGREKFMARLAKKYPDKTFDNDDDLYDQIDSDYDEYESAAKNYRERESAMTELFNRDGRSAAFLDKWSKGGDPVALLVKIFGPELRESLDDPKKAEALAEASKEYMARISKQKTFEESSAKNLVESNKKLDEMVDGGELSHDDSVRAMSMLAEVACNAIHGIYSPEHIRMALKAANHDSDVAQAGHDGEVRGRNAKITEGLKKREATDGTATLGGMNGRTSRNMGGMSMFDLAEGAS